ncbi:MAG TPA: hypothetical protein DCZ88_16095 [Pseudanabaena sp.]|nr:hypothetical protein [Pseudanabaena sp.]
MLNLRNLKNINDLIWLFSSKLSVEISLDEDCRNVSHVFGRWFTIFQKHESKFLPSKNFDSEVIKFARLN